MTKVIDKKREKELARVEFLLGARPQDGIERYRWDIVREVKNILFSWKEDKEEIAGRRIGGVILPKPIDHNYKDGKHIVVYWHTKKEGGDLGLHISFSKNSKVEADLKARGICFVCADPIGDRLKLEQDIYSALVKFFAG